ncbi:MAG: 50S ribosomal protein L9 [Bacteroidetes bacterium]|nr:50S ribosomal protein L9 [Bacteroidota bacterium]MDA0904298.1 50S ribosomal protein L9 [Bacteroidota bacterium]MDA1241840.1 50S ribosomal protein L9 [Bacteroidota bacterium]
MDIILKQDVDTLGSKYDVVTVKDGYARNFLIPQGMAVAATASNLKVNNEVIRQQAHKAAKAREAAQAIADKLSGLTLKLGAKAGESGKIFGSVNTIQLADAIQAAGYDVERKQISMSDDHIKELGSYEATVKLHKEVHVTVKFDVVAE